MSKIKKALLLLGVTGAVAGSAVGAQAAINASSWHVGGISLYETKLKCCDLGISLGSDTAPTTVATRAVPPGNYLVSGMISVGAQPGSEIACEVANTAGGNDGVFGVYQNQTGQEDVVNVHEQEVVSVASGQKIYLTCEDNNAQPNDGVGEAVIEAIPVNYLH